MIPFKYKTIYVPQIDETDCGAACLAMILRKYHSRVSITHIRHFAKTNTEGTTALGLLKTAKKYNMDVQAVKADMSLFEVSNVQYPFIAHVIKDNNLLHYYVVLENTGKDILVADPEPEAGIKRMTKSEFKNEWTGVTLFMEPNKNFVPIKEKKNNLLSLFPYMLKQRYLIKNIVLAAAMMTIISVCSSYFVQGLIDNYIPKERYTMLSIVSLGLIVAYIFNSLFSYIQSTFLNILGQRLSINLNLTYIRHLFELPLEFFNNRKTGEITSRFYDASRVIEAMASTVISLFLDLSIVIVMGVILAIQNSLLFLITCLFLPFYIIVILSFARRFERLNNDQMESNALVSSSIIEDIQGIETIKALNSEKIRYKNIDNQFMDYLKKSFKYSKVEALQVSLKIFIRLALNITILWMGATFVIKNRMTIGELMAFNALLSYFIDPLQNIINLQPTLQSANVAQNRLNEVYFEKSEFISGNDIKDVKALKGDIVFSNVSFRYGYGKNVLNKINFKIKLGEKLTIIGMSGSGKSTLVKLLVNFFSPLEGKIMLNKNLTTKIDKHILRSYVNYIPQAPYIFSGSIRENLLLGSRSNLTKEDLKKACDIAEITEDIKKLPLGLETKLDENAKILSGGQKQRLTIARAVISPAKVLIFDEVTSGLDTITEKKVVDNLMKLSDRTIIFIAHRLSIAKRTDNIIVLDHGKIVEKGNHSTLMKKHGYYFNFIKR